jgi:hypothetical protein
VIEVKGHEWPADAARSLCRACKGTHGNVAQEREPIEVTLAPVQAVTDGGDGG